MRISHIAVFGVAIILLSVFVYYAVGYVSPMFGSNSPKTTSVKTTSTTCATCQVCLNEKQIKDQDIKIGHAKQQYDLLTLRYNDLNKSIQPLRDTIRYMRNETKNIVKLINLSIKIINDTKWNKTTIKNAKQLNTTLKSARDKMKFISLR